MTIEKYYFTKNVNDEVLDEAIKLRSDLGNIYLGSSVEINQDESVNDDNIEIRFNRAITAAEKDQIINLINLIDDNYDLVIRKKIEQDTMVRSMQFGQQFLAQFSANNIYRGKSAVQVAAIIQTYPDLINYALTGSMSGLHYMVSNMTPDENISQEEIDEFKKRIEFFLVGLQ